MKDKRPHTPVLEQEVLGFFSEIRLSTFFEGTVGAGGHAKSILQAHPEIKKYIGCDRDTGALELARGVLSPWKEKVELVHSNFADLDEILESRALSSVDGFFLI